MSVAEASIEKHAPWWRPFHLWRQLGAVAGLSIVCAIASWHFLNFGLTPAGIDQTAGNERHVTFVAYFISAVTALLVFDGCWLACLQGASLKQALLTPFTARFWWSAFAWVVINLMLLGMLFCVQQYVSFFEKIGPGSSKIGWNILGLLGVIFGYALIWIRFRLVLWPLHVFATGRLLDLTPAWKATGAPGCNLLGLTLGLVLAALVIFAVGSSLMLYSVNFVGATTSQGFLFAAILAFFLFRAAQLAAFLECYCKHSGIVAR